MPAALEGIKILDVTNYIAGPYASLLLADLGADVYKIETPGKGDPFRTWDKEPKDYSPSFCALNRNKKSVTLDMKAPEGREVFLKLAGTRTSSSRTCARAWWTGWASATTWCGS